ncbi:hypothetical protein SKAU_G00135800 [Synaphobranchus kaupii]|uniref:Uncharacterized protein n=1 Tax=Synaphobranchus kaupii TaxID=118154 RepID=A0A9Q1FRI2_SYNKA|nr:hypothetical protein SKAU_G00135800 [Synaphobranchus kaupii]
MAVSTRSPSSRARGGGRHAADHSVSSSQVGIKCFAGIQRFGSNLVCLTIGLELSDLGNQGCGPPERNTESCPCEALLLAHPW